MKISVILFILAITFSNLQACVTYNPGTQTYVVDTYGSWELASERSDQYDRKKIKPKESSGSSWERCLERPKIVKQPRSKDWFESH